MLTDKRQFKRFDIQLFIDFKPSKGVLTYSRGVIRDLSYDGLSFESTSPEFKLNENLKFSFIFPQKRTVVSVLGTVIWKKQVENKYLAGIKLGAMDEKTKRDIFEKICVYGDIPADRFFYGNAPANVPKKTDTERSVEKSGSRTKRSKK